MARFFVFHIGSVVVMLLMARQTLAARRTIPTTIKWRHYIFMSFIVFMSVSGLSQGCWTLGRLLQGEMVSRLDQHFIALRELPPILGVVFWAFGVIGTSITALLVLGMARSNGQCRAIFLKLFPLLILAEGLSSCIDLRGSDGLGFVQGSSLEYFVAFCLWSLFAWPYVLAYRFYRGASSDILFAEPESRITDIRCRDDWP